jgi:hypothetical protein
MTGPRRSVDPATSREFVVGFSEPGDTEVFFPETAAWEPRFGWLTPERVSIRWSPEFDQPDWPVRQAVLRLAKVLNAEVVGDEGEEYPPP